MTVTGSWGCWLCLMCYRAIAKLTHLQVVATCMRPTVTMCHFSICFWMRSQEKNAPRTHCWRAQTHYYIHMTNPPIQTLVPANHLVRTWSSYAICPLGLTLIYQINAPITLIMQDNRTTHKTQWDPSVHGCFCCQTEVIETEIMTHK